MIHAITSPPPERYDADKLLALSRDHWQIEDRLVHVRDVTFKEDASRIRSGNASIAVAHLRNAILTVIRNQKLKPRPAREAYAANHKAAVRLLTRAGTELPCTSPRASLGVLSTGAPRRSILARRGGVEKRGMRRAIHSAIWRRSAAVVMLSVWIWPGVPFARAEEPPDHVAVIIGNNDYPAAPLRNAANDAALVAKALAETGFAVSVHIDVTSAEVPALLDEIRERFRGAKIGLVYYAGHAFQYNGENQLLSVDVPEMTAAVIDAKRLPLREVLAAAATQGGGSGGGLRLVILDGCRNDPFSTVGGAYSRGLAFEESGADETLIAYSTGAGQLAFDGPNNGNSPFALSLARAIERPGVTVSDMLRSIRRDVRLATEARQIPWVVGSIETDYVVNRSAATSDPVAEVGAEVPLDEVVWWSIRAEITPDELSRFVQVFPNSRYVPEASTRLREIELAGADATRAVVIDGETIPSQSVTAVLDLRAKVPATGGGYEPRTSIPAELFNIWPKVLPGTTGGLGEIVTECDLIAGDPADQQRVAPAVEWGLVNARRAARVCGYALAADPGNPRLAFQLGRALDIGENFPWARYFYGMAATAGYAEAMTSLGYMAIEGRGGEIDYAAAADWYRRAAALGNLRARTNIGEIYVKGQGVPPQPEEAILWYRLAAGMGWPNAQNALADMYRRGQGVEKDERASAALYDLAAANGQREAMNSLGRSYLNGWGVEKDRARARVWFDRAIDAGDRYAPFFLARDLVSTGEGAKDPGAVVNLLTLSADRGFREAYLELGTTYANGKILAANPAQALFWARLAEISEIKGAAELVARLRAELGPKREAEVERLIEERRQLTGL